MKKNKIITILSLGTLGISTGIAVSVALSSCDTDKPKECNPLSDFAYQVSSINDYIKDDLMIEASAIDTHLKGDDGKKEGIIILGWENKPRLINNGKTVSVNIADHYKVNNKEYDVIALGQECFGKEMYNDWSLANGSKYDYDFHFPSTLLTMFNSACSWFGLIPAQLLPECVNSIDGFTGREEHYPHIKVDMSKCNLYCDGEDKFLQGNPLRGAYNYNFAFQNVDKFIWPTHNTNWDRIADDIMEDAYITCDMDLRGLTALTTIGHWGIGRWQMSDNDVYLPNTINELTWEAFNGSKIRDLYWNCNPSDITKWNVFTDAGQEITDYINGLFDFIKEYIDVTLIEDLVDELLKDITSYDGGKDVFIFGNLEIGHFHTGSVQNKEDWTKYTSEYVDVTNTNGHGTSLPTLFWMVGMADCPETSVIDVVA